MNSCFIILAGGESKRFNSKTPKPYHLYKNKPLLLHSIDKAKDYGKFSKIILVINKKHKSYIDKLKIKYIKIIIGERTRDESAYKGLKSIKNYNIKNVMIHDAARPDFSLKLLDKLYNEKIILDHGLKVATELANVLSGGDTSMDKALSEDDLFKLELDAFMKLIETKETQDRIKYTLSTGKPLVN